MLLAAAVLAPVLLAAGCGTTSATPPAVEQGPSISAAARSTAVPPLVKGPKGAIKSSVPVIRVVDGDTLHVLVDGIDTTVRVIGIDTPETVKPGAPVECFGPQASDFAHDMLDGHRVTLEFDGSQGPQDRFGRTLAHVWVENADGTLTSFEWAAVSGGFADERVYGDSPHAWHDELAAAEEAARAAGVGMWGAC